MIGIEKHIRILVYLGVFSSRCFADPATLILGDSVGENLIRINLQYAGIFQDEQPTTYSGTIEVELEIDTESDEVKAFEMTGGQISATDMNFNFDAGFFGSQNILLLDAKATPMSPDGSEVLVDPGVFSAPKHVFEFNEGRSETSGSFGEGEANIADDPFFANGETTGTIDLSNKRELLSSLDGRAIAQAYDVAFSVDLDSSSTSELDGQEVTIDTQGVVTAEGVVRVPANDFFDWAFLNAPDAGLALGFRADANLDGVVDGVSWALGHPPAERHSEVLRFNREENRLEIGISPLGTRAALRIMTSESLSADDWSEVPAEQISVGVNPIEVGESGEVFVNITGGDRRFYRIEVIEP